MFALVQKYLRRIGDVHTETETIATLKDICVDLGFRSAFMMEYSPGQIGLLSFFDTSSTREGWFAKYMQITDGGEPAILQAMLERSGVHYIGDGRFSGENDPVRVFSETADLVELVVVPVQFDDDEIGIAGFSGWPQLSREQQTTLQVLVYALFSQSQKMRTGERADTPAKLTRREKEVMSLAVEGLTSSVIAKQLKLSARTVNQHVENVAGKLGTKNRVHTAAEVVRNRLLGP